jgi:hypothetical protein
MKTRKAHEQRLLEMRARFAEVRQAQAQRERDRGRGLRTYRLFQRLTKKLNERVDQWEDVKGELEYRVQCPDVEVAEMEELERELAVVELVLGELYRLQGEVDDE